MFKEEIISSLHIFFQKLKNRDYFPTHSMKPALLWHQNQRHYKKNRDQYLSWIYIKIILSKFNLALYIKRINVIHHTCACLVAQLGPTLCDPMDCSPPGSSVHGDSPGQNTGVGCHALLQGIFSTQGSNSGLPSYRWILYHLSHQGSPRILEWVAYPFSRRSSPPRNQTEVSCIAGGFFTSWAT